MSTKLSKSCQDTIAQLKSQLKAAESQRPVNQELIKSIRRQIENAKAEDLAYKPLTEAQLSAMTLTQLKMEMAKTGAPQLVQDIYAERKNMLRLRSQARSLVRQGLTVDQADVWVSDEKCGTDGGNIIIDMYQMCDNAIKRTLSCQGSNPESNIRDGGHSLQHVWLYKKVAKLKLPNSGSHNNNWSVVCTMLADSAKDPDDIIQDGCYLMLRQEANGNAKDQPRLWTVRNQASGALDNTRRVQSTRMKHWHEVVTTALMGSKSLHCQSPMVWVMLQEHGEQIQQRVEWLREDLDEEKAWLLEALMCGWTHRECAEALGKTTKTIQRWSRALELAGADIMQYA